MSRKRASGPIQPPDPQKAYRTGVGVVLALPIVLGVALNVLSPSHFRPLLASFARSRPAGARGGAGSPRRRRGLVGRPQHLELVCTALRLARDHRDFR